MTTHPQVRPRAERSSSGNGTAPAAREVRLPTRPRRLGQWAATVLFVLVSVVAAAWFWQQQGDRVEVLVVAREVPAGHVVERSALSTASVAGVDGAIPVSEVDRVVGSTAAVGLVPGQVLTDPLLTVDAVPAANERVVGLDLDPTRAPMGLMPGDVVTVLAVPPSGDPGDPESLARTTVLAETAEVLRAESIDGGGLRLSLVVEDGYATDVASFGAAGRVAVIQSPRAMER